MPFFLKFQGNNRQNASAMKSAKGETEEKGCIFTVLWEMKQPHTMTGPCFSGCVLEYGFLSPQYGEKKGLFLSFFR